MVKPSKALLDLDELVTKSGEMKEGEPGRVLMLRIPARCQHPRVSVRDRALECDDCGTTIDPLDWIGDHVLTQPGRLGKERSRLEAELADLRRQRARLDAQLARLHRRLQGLGVRPLPKALPPGLGAVAAIGDPSRPIGVHIRLLRGRFSRDEARRIACAIESALDGGEVG